VSSLANEVAPFVSVIIPVLNCAGDVKGSIAALRAQDYPSERFEILVVDNGSTDDTVLQLESCGIAALHRADRGRSRALNEGLKHARGSIVCSTDISCRPEPRWIAEIVSSFEDPSVGCVAGEIGLLKTRDNLAIRYQERRDYMSPMGAMQRTRPPFLPYADGANASFRREVFDKIGPFEESFVKAADVEVCYRMLFLTDFKIAFNRRAIVWEPGEETLRALLRQRYRIGIGNVLLQARFPALFQAQAKRSVRASYWTLRENLDEMPRMVGWMVNSLWNPRDRDLLANAAVSRAMSIAQALGRREGRRFLRATPNPPAALNSKRIKAYALGEWTASSRVLAM
jgi:cellulose synthase/poly-beta-1,6-N-acetylglucosamine synthase-like glycosyltransferase